MAERPGTRGRQGQIAIEFSFMVMLAFIFFAVVLIIVGAYIERAATQRRDAALTDEASRIRQELLLAAAAPDGYERTFAVPHDVDGYTYGVSNAEGTLTLTIGEASLTTPIPPLAGSLVKGENTLRKRDGLLEVS